MEKMIKLSAIERLAGKEPKNEQGSSMDSEEYSNGHGCKCSCCGAPCDTCEEADTEHEPADMTEDQD